MGLRSLCSSCCLVSWGREGVEEGSLGFRVEEDFGFHGLMGFLPACSSEPKVHKKRGLLAKGV